MKINKNEIRGNAEKILGKEEVAELLSSPITEAHQKYSDAYNRFNDELAGAYENVMTLKMMKVTA